MRKKQNQIFTHIAYKKFKEKLETQCKIYDINLILQEESYTSKSSFLDNEILPVYQEKEDDDDECEDEEYEFKGKRKGRGLYITQSGKKINADVNAAANIIRKCKQKFNIERLYKWVQTTPSKIKL